MLWTSNAWKLSKSARSIRVAASFYSKYLLDIGLRDSAQRTYSEHAKSLCEAASMRGMAHRLKKPSLTLNTLQNTPRLREMTSRKRKKSSGIAQQGNESKKKKQAQQKEHAAKGIDKAIANNGESRIIKKRKKSKVENDLEVYADKAFKQDLVHPNEEFVQPIREGKAKGNKELHQGNGKSNNQKKEQSSGMSTESGSTSSKSKQKKANLAPVSVAEVMKRLEAELVLQPERYEMRLDGALDTASKKVMDQAVKELGLHWQVYGAKSSLVKIVSKFPLPRYRPEFDPRILQRHKISISPGTRRVLELALNTMKQKTGKDDWILDSNKKGQNLHETQIPNAFAKSINGNLSPPEAPQTASTPKSKDFFSPGKYVSRRLETKLVCTNPSEESTRMRAAQNSASESLKGQQMLGIRKKLPAWKEKQNLLDIIERNQVVVVSGETGCGKTTQLPQFILESEIEAGRGDKCNIICTQPRRISAMSVAQRVAEERAEPIGQTVGYQIRLDSERSGKTKLLFCTSGVLLRKLMSDRILDGISHIVVDEIHERGMNEDFLLIVLKSLLQKRNDLRLILMSATLNAKVFSKFFGGAPATHIPGFTFPVKEYYLEDVLELTNYRIVDDSDNPDKRKVWFQKTKDQLYNSAMLSYVPSRNQFKGYKDSSYDSIKTWASSSNEKVHCGAMQAIVQHICLNEPPGGILVFLTGWDDISSLMDSLMSNGVTGDPSRVLLLPLHSTMDAINQQLIFKNPPAGIRKVVLATNIAETSITINDIVYVVNGGKAKEKSYDALNKIACLFPTWVSKASCKQRKGRAGRVTSGVAYHMFPKPMFENCFMEHQLPEIMRTPLEDLCLQIKSLGLGGIRAFLSEAMNPPTPQAIQNAIMLLQSIGAMDKDENLTALGRHLSHLPVQPGIGKMILMGAMFGALDPMLTIAAATTVKDPFMRPLSSRKEADSIRQNLAAGTRSDHIALIRAFHAFREVKKLGANSKWTFCRSHFLHGQSLEQMEQMRYSFAELLCNIGFLTVNQNNTALTSRRRSPSGRFFLQSLDDSIERHSKNATNLELLRSVLCAGMFPSVALVVNGKTDSRKPSFSTLDDGACRPHPCSVNGSEKFFPHRWLVYNDKVHTGGIFFRASTMVTDLALLLLGSNLEVQGKGNFSILGGRYLFSAEPEVTSMIVDLQKELQELLEKKVQNPRLDLDSEGGTVVAAVMTLLSNEGEPNKPRLQQGEGPEQDYGVENGDMVVGMD